MIKPKDFGPKGPTPSELAEIASGARMANILPDIKYEIDQTVEGVKNRVFAQIRDGSFTPVLAEAAWREIHAAHMLLKKFQTRVSLGIDGANKHAKSLTIGEE